MQSFQSIAVLIRARAGGVLAFQTLSVLVAKLFSRLFSFLQRGAFLCISNAIAGCGSDFIPLLEFAAAAIVFATPTMP